LSKLLRGALTTVITLALLVGVGLPAAAASPSTAAATSHSVAQYDLRSAPAGTPLRSAATILRPQVVPALVVLGALARLGIGWVLKWYGKTQLKKAAKSYLLNQVRADKWTHIMDPKHKWDSVGARSKDEIAELMSRAMANGKHTDYAGGGAKVATWNHQGKTIQVTYSKSGGQISNGWVQ
jgi:hypothetical protein